jgi:hypothetical protein
MLNFRLFIRIFWVRTFLFSVLTFILASPLMAQPLEEMEFNVRLGFVTGGKATLIAKNDVIDQKQAIYYYLQGRTTGFISKLYEINDVFETWVDPETYLPIKSIRIVKEQKYRFYDEVTYDHVNDSIFSIKSGRKKVPRKVNDLVSVFFYIRHNLFFEDLLAGKQIKIPVYHGAELFIMNLVYMGSETINTKIGKQDCYVVSPKVPEGDMIKGSNGLRIYITKDAKRLPIYAEFDLILGALKCELNSYKINGVDQMLKQ